MTMHLLRRFLRSAVTAMLSVAATAAFADNLRMIAPLAGNVSVPVVSMKEARFVRTLHQQYDFSCGSAAVATLLTHHYGHKVSEAEVFQAMFEHGDRDKIRAEGFSMLDMKRYLDAQGFPTIGVEASLDELANAKVPAIALINENGYAHFVVVKGVRAEDVVIGDPAMGTRVLGRTQFESYRMNNILLVVNERTELARFDLAEDWRVRPKAPVGDPGNRNFADLQLLQRRSLVDF
jgi:predicted double-glycine peptidase